MICEVSVLPPLVTPLLEVETSACATVADYAPPAVPPVESVLESPGYTVPEDLGCSWMPDFVPGSDGTNTDQGGYLQSLREPLTGTPPTTPMVAVNSPPLELQNPCGSESTPVTLVSPAATEGVVTDETGPDLSREGPFDACDADHEAGQSPIPNDVIRRASKRQRFRPFIWHAFARPPYDGVYGGARISASARPDARILA